MKKQLVITILFFGCILKGMAQLPYIDLGTIPTTYVEMITSNMAKGGKTGLAAEYMQQMFVSTTEGVLARSSLGFPSTWIDFTEYSENDLCGIYRSTGKKTLCKARVEYLKKSYLAVFELLMIRPANQIRNGVKDQIWEKYASICNVILKDLDRMRRIAEEDREYSIMGYSK